LDETLLDKIYETVLFPDAWDEVLRELSDGLGAEGGALIWQDIYTNAAEGIFGRTDPEAIALFSGYFATRNPLRQSPAEVRRRIAAWRPRIILDEDCLPKDAFLKTEFYNDFFRRFDYHSSLAIGLELDGRHGGTLDLLKSRRAGAFTTEQLALAREAQPHLRRAFRAGRDVARAKAGLGASATNAFDASPIGVLVLTAERRVLYANPAADALARSGVAIRLINGVFDLADAAAAVRLEALVRLAADRDEERRAGGVMAAPASGDRLPVSIAVTPLRVERHPLFTEPAAFVTVSDPARDIALSPDRFREVFGLTEMEVKVATGLFGGESSREVAGRLGISVNTVRNHLARILEKTQSSSQAELSRRLMSLS
jgi:DNA-binding CsgD family transcriptional regulator/PAS domain-containing protein